MALFKQQPKAPPVPLTREQKIERHQRAAEEFLARAKKGGRIEEGAHKAAIATAHASLALSYQLDRGHPDPALEAAATNGEASS